MDTENFIYFINKAYKLETSPFWKWINEKGKQTDWAKIAEFGWLAHDGLQEEDMESFCLNLRFFIQPRDGFSIPLIALKAQNLPEKYAEHKNRIANAVATLEDKLNEKSLIQIYDDRITTNLDVFDVLFYGGIVHANKEKRVEFHRLVTSGDFSYFVFRSFVCTLHHYRNCIQTLAYHLYHYLDKIGVKVTER